MAKEGRKVSCSATTCAGEPMSKIQVLVSGAGRGGTNLGIEMVRALGINTTAQVEDRTFFRSRLPDVYATKLATENKGFTFNAICSKMEEYPNLKIVFITRHPFDNILSKIRRGAPRSLGGDNGGEEWMPDGTPLGATMAVEYAYSILNSLKESKYANRVKTVKMEDMILSPKQTVDDVASFLNRTPTKESYLFYKNNRNVHQKHRYSDKLSTEQIDLYKDLESNFLGFFKQGKDIMIPFLSNRVRSLATSNGYTVDLTKHENKLNKVYFGINGQFGDIIIQEPSLRSFIEDHPETKIVLGCNKKYQQAIELYKGYHENIIDFKLWDGYSNWPSPEDAAYIQEQNFDFVCNAQPQHTMSDWAAHLHQTEESGLMQSIIVKDTQISLPMPSNIVDHDKTVAISLFPNWPNGGVKAFPVHTVTNIVKIVNKLGYKVLHLNGPNEPDIPNTTKVNGSYIDSVRNLLGTDLLLTCDTGMAWVASAYQHPTIGFYAWGYNPVARTSKNWQPTNPNAEYIEAGSVNDISKRDIVEAIYRRLK